MTCEELVSRVCLRVDFNLAYTRVFSCLLLLFVFLKSSHPLLSFQWLLATINRSSLSILVFFLSLRARSIVVCRCSQAVTLYPRRAVIPNSSLQNFQLVSQFLKSYIKSVSIACSFTCTMCQKIIRILGFEVGGPIISC